MCAEWKNNAAGNPFAWRARPAFHIAVTFPLFNTRINSSQQITANVKLVWIGGEKKGTSGMHDVFRQTGNTDV